MKEILKDLGYQKWEVSILLVDDHQIKKINKKYLRRNRPTDVISFSQIEGEFRHITTHLLGDVVISVETAKRQAKENDIILQDEITFLLIHGILHLLGYDHEGSVRKEREMRAKERKLLAVLRDKLRS
ncbi:MAG: rRNA maturation RNase YbeY [Thermodesulfobacteriota bacterium]